MGVGKSRGKFLFIVYLFFFLMFYIFLREHSRGEAERGGNRIRSGLCTDSSEPDVGLELMNWEIMTRAELTAPPRLPQCSARS